MKLILITITIITSMLLTGCTTTEYIYRDKIKYVKPNNSILKFDVVTPKFDVNKTTYINSDPFTREKYLTAYIVKLLNTVKKHKVKNKKINDWYKDLNSTVVE